MIAIMWVAIGLLWAASLAAGLWAATRRTTAAGAADHRGLALRAYPLVIAVLVLAVPLVMVARVEFSDGGEASAGLDPVGIVVGSAAVAIVGFVLFMIGLNLAGFDPGARQIARRLRDDEASQRLLTRWLQRVRWRRWLGGFLGVLAGLLMLDNGSGWGRVLLFGLAGIAIGSLSAELHHLRSAGGTEARVADLTQRRFADYTVRAEELLLAAVAAAAFVVLAIGSFDTGPGGRLWAVAVLVAVALVVGFQWRIVTRRRPALPTELREADDLLRRLAVSRGVARPGLAVALALLAQALGAIGFEGLALLCWLAAVATWWMGRRLGLDHLLRQRVAVA